MGNITKRDFETQNCTIDCTIRDLLNDFNIEEINSLYKDEIYNTVMLDKNVIQGEWTFCLSVN